MDLVVMKYSCQTNGYDTLNLTKSDILDDLEEIKVAVRYLVDRKELLGFPWKTSIGAASSYEELPENCKNNLGFIGEYLGIPIEWIGVGPGRESTIEKDCGISL